MMDHGHGCMEGRTALRQKVRPIEIQNKVSQWGGTEGRDGQSLLRPIVLLPIRLLPKLLTPREKGRKEEERKVALGVTVTLLHAGRSRTDLRSESD